MVRSELVAKLAAENPSLKKSELEKVVSGIFDAMAEQLASGGRVELRGFGMFSVRQYKARMGRNPRTGEPVSLPATAVSYFRAGKDLRDRLNPDRG